MALSFKQQLQHYNANFEAGLVYFIYGECDPYNWPGTRHYGTAYKIGMTRHSPEYRIKDSQGWHRRNVRVIHTIQVDIMRVVEKMCHVRFEDRRVDKYFNYEWFKIGDKISEISTYKSIQVSHALHLLADSEDIYRWWSRLSPNRRCDVARSLWDHPNTKINQ